MLEKLKELAPQLAQASNWEDLLYRLADATRELTEASAAGVLLFWESAGLMATQSHLGVWEAPGGQDLSEEQREKLLAWLEGLVEATSQGEAGGLPSYIRQALGAGEDGAVAIAPLTLAERNIGMIYVLRPGQEDLNQARLLLEGLAAWAAPTLAGMEARMLQKEYAASFVALQKLNQDLPTTGKPEGVWGQFLEGMVRGMRLESGAIYLEGTEGGRESLSSAYGPHGESLLAASQERYSQGFASSDPIPHRTTLASPGEGERQLVQFPVASEGQFLGVMTLSSLPGALLTGPQVDLLGFLARCAGTALQVRLMQGREARHRRQLAALHKLSQAIGSLDEGRIVEFVHAELAQALPCTLSALLLVDGEEARLILNGPEPISDQARESVQERMLESYRVLAGREAKLGKVATRGPEGREGEGDIGFHLTVPLLAASEVLGVLSVNSHLPHAFDTSDLRFLTAVADHITAGLEAMRLLQESHCLAITDDLTGPYNFRHFREVLARELALALRHQHHLALMMIDIDGLKQVNDAYGHLAGNRVLQQVAQMLRSSARGTDLAARIGGDEFAVIMPHTSHPGALSLMSRLREAGERHSFRVDGESVAVSMSMGVASLEGLEDRTASALIQQADRELYREKQRKERTLRDD
jgi:diguanylate cyclase (GGDEF)-like protein